MSAPAPSSVGVAPGRGEVFRVHLPAFDGPFDLLLSLINKHKLDITDIALATVTDEFLTFTRRLDDWDLGAATEFLVVAATLLDLKIARLLPGREAADDEDLALLEARDLLFARLLQYRAYKQVAGYLAQRLEAESASRWRDAPWEPWLTSVLPDVVLTIGPDELARLAASAMQPPERPFVAINHLHLTVITIAELTERVLRELQAHGGRAHFAVLTAPCESLLDVVGTFLALLELFRRDEVAFDQVGPLSDLWVRLTPSAATWSSSEPGGSLSVSSPVASRR